LKAQVRGFGLRNVDLKPSNAGHESLDICGRGKYIFHKAEECPAGMDEEKYLYSRTRFLGDKGCNFTASEGRDG
jgi:hypothetical protein